MIGASEKVDEFIESTERWQEEMLHLRRIILSCGLVEEWKWRQPCYSIEGKNICIIGGFKAFCALSFFKGVLLSDVAGILSKPGENSQSTRMLRVTTVGDILDNEELIRSYIFEAIAIEKSGTQVSFTKRNELVFPKELLDKFKSDLNFKKAFETLPPGKQRGFNLYFSGAKRSKSRTDRIEKCVPRILIGKGLHDCICGLSKRMPRCDGSHQALE